MKRNQMVVITACILYLIGVISCSETVAEDTPRLNSKQYKFTDGSIDLIKIFNVQGHDYIILKNNGNYGDLEHFAGCNNLSCR